MGIGLSTALSISYGLTIGLLSNAMFYHMLAGGFRKTVEVDWRLQIPSYICSTFGIASLGACICVARQMGSYSEKIGFNQAPVESQEPLVD